MIFRIFLMLGLLAFMLIGACALLMYTFGDINSGWFYVQAGLWALIIAPCIGAVLQLPFLGR